MDKSCSYPIIAFSFVCQSNSPLTPSVVKEPRHVGVSLFLICGWFKPAVLKLAAGTPANIFSKNLALLRTGLRTILQKIKSVCCWFLSIFPLQYYLKQITFVGLTEYIVLNYLQLKVRLQTISLFDFILTF